MESLDAQDAAALLAWQVELGATDAIADAPLNRYTLADRVAGAAKLATPVPTKVETVTTDPVATAEQAARSAPDLNALKEALASFEHCSLKRGARNLVFGDGHPGAPVMIIGEAPGREEDRAGRPFVGRAGQLLDRMLSAIDAGREHAETPVYITNILPWRPPQNRDPSADEIAMMRPFVLRHIELAAPKMLVVMGNISAQALLGKRGITRLRGQWTEVHGLPVLPMFHPAYLLRNPAAKREAWADLLALKVQLLNTE